MYRYSRADLLRILRLTARQFAAWEKAGLVPESETYSFFDLLQIKKIRDLCARKVRPAVIRQSLEAMQKQVAGMENPLLEAGAFTTQRHRVAFRHEGKVLEPIAGQFMFDFNGDERVVNGPRPQSPKPQTGSPDVAELFARGIALEEDPNNADTVIRLRLDVFDIVNSGRKCALVQGDDALLHLVCRHAVVRPHHADDWDIDVRKDIYRHGSDSGTASDQNEQCSGDEGIGSAKRRANDPHSTPILPVKHDSVMMLADGRLMGL